MRRFSYLVAFALVALGAWILQASVFLVGTFLAVAILIVLFYPVYYDWNIRKSIQKVYQDAKMRASLDSRTLRITPEYLEEQSSLGEVKIKWNVIGNITVTPTRTFVTVVGEAPGMVISRERVTAGNYVEFIAALRAHVDTKATQ